VIQPLGQIPGVSEKHGSEDNRLVARTVTEMSLKDLQMDWGTPRCEGRRPMAHFPLHGLKGILERQRREGVDPSLLQPGFGEGRLNVVL
jgi:hypothetical protein